MDYNKTINFPEAARQAKVSGRVLVGYVIDKEGRVVNAQILESLGYGCDEEALKMVKRMSFTPARHNGEPVNVRMIFPVTFKM